MLGRFMVITGILALVVGILILILASIPDMAEITASLFCQNIENNGFNVQCNDSEEPLNVSNALMTLGIVLTIGGSLALAFGFVVGLVRLSGKVNHILKVGETAHATILSVDSTGVTVNNQPMLKIRMLVQPNFGQAYEVETNRVIPHHTLSYLASGMTVPVKYLPDKPEDVALDLQNLAINPMNISGGMMSDSLISADAMPKRKNIGDLSAKLQELQESYEQGLINQEEYEDARKRILNSF